MHVEGTPAVYEDCGIIIIIITTLIIIIIIPSSQPLNPHPLTPTPFPLPHPPRALHVNFLCKLGGAPSLVIWGWQGWQ